jgi:hypothetical protein
VVVAGYRIAEDLHRSGDEDQPEDEEHPI